MKNQVWSNRTISGGSKTVRVGIVFTWFWTGFNQPQPKLRAKSKNRKIEYKKRYKKVINI